MGRRVVFLLGLGAFASTILAQAPGTFSATGSMTTSRFLHTATLLADGRVLIAGGDTQKANAATATFFKTQSSAELYDPRTGTFNATGDMTTPRGGHTATLLPNGKVLIAGGGVTNAVEGLFGDPIFASAELFDPDAGAFSATGDMTTSRFGSTATLLNNGKVLITGGYQRDPGALSPRLLTRAELYDPSTGTFTATGDMISAWVDTATLLPNGKVLITSGNPDGPPPYLSSAELYDPSTGTFTATGGMTVGREDHTAALLPDGTVLFAGGAGFTGSAELYDPLKGMFTSTGSMAGNRERQTATLLNDGRVLIAGGEVTWISSILASAEIYTPSVLVPPPMLLSLSGDGKGQGAVQHAGTTRIASADDPAVAGEYLSIYLTGLADGSVIPPQVAIGGRLAVVTFFGNVPGYPGLNVVNIQMPSGVVPGDSVPVHMTYLSRASNEVTIGVQ